MPPGQRVEPAFERGNIDRSDARRPPLERHSTARSSAGQMSGGALDGSSIWTASCASALVRKVEPGTRIELVTC